MRDQRTHKHVLWLAALLVGLVVLQGCAVKIPDSPMEYLQYRWNDACEILELGATYSTGEPQFGFYVCGVGVLGPVGIADLDVQFVGLGGGQFMGIGDGDGKLGSIRHRLKGAGVFLYGEEEMAWGDYNPRRPETINDQSQGILGIIGAPLGPDPRGFMQGVQEAERMSHPSYFISCLHYLHLGHFGFVWNIRYLEPFDFIAGIFCLDPFQDDGPQPGRWTGQDKGKTASELEEEYSSRGMRSYVVPASSDPKGNLPPIVPAGKAKPEDAAKDMMKPTSLPKTEAPLPDEARPIPPPGTSELPKPAEPMAEKPAAPKAAAPVEPEPIDPTPPAPEPKIVEVEPGETLSDIAKREYGNGNKWRIIAKANEDTLKDPNKLRPGMKLKVPVLAAPKAEAAPEGKTYTVQKNDTFYSIARAQYNDARQWKLIYEANRERLNLKSVKSIRPGMTLLIPDLPEEEKAEE